MSPRKSTSKTDGLLPKLKHFLEALGDRYQRVLSVIDEALSSDSLKDKIWAVDLILKRTPAAPPAAEAAKPDLADDADALPDPEKMSDAELLSQLRKYLKDQDL